MCATTRGLCVFNCRAELVRLCEVVGLNLCEKSGDCGDEGIHNGGFLEQQPQLQTVERSRTWGLYRW